MPTSQTSARFGRRSTRGVLLGFTGWRVGALGVAIVAVLFWLLVVGGLGGFGIGLLAAAGPVAVAFTRVGGLPTVEWTPTALHWQARVLAGQTTYRARPTGPRPAGTLALPGDAASLRFHVPEAQPVCMIHDPWRNTLSAVLHVRHPAYVLLSPDEQAQRVSAWGRVQASLAQSEGCAGLQIMEAAIPDSGQGVRDWYERHASHRDGWAARQYEELLSATSVGSSTHRSTITLSLDLRASASVIRASGGGLAGAAKVLGGDMEALEYGLRQAGLDFGWWATEPEVAAMVRSAYDPALGGEFGPTSPGANLARGGPLALDEHWSYLRHDSGYSTVLWISEWPRIEVAAHFLHPLIFAPDVRKTLSIHMRPKNVSSALRQIRRDKTAMEADRRQKEKIGQIHDLADDQEWTDVVARERALIAGHAEVDYFGWIVVTADDLDELRSAVKQVERAASQAVCETRVLYGQQAQGFVTAGLPLGRSSF